MQSQELRMLQDHPLRQNLNDEAHARPAPALPIPCLITHLVQTTGEAGAAADREHVAALCRRFGQPVPADGANHHLVDCGGFRLKWERHAEFSDYAFIRPGPPNEIPPELAGPPADWLEALPGPRLVGVKLWLEGGDAPHPTPERLQALFGGDDYCGGLLWGGVAAAWTDFRIQSDGYTRILVRDQGLTAWRAGRLAQRLLEIETYRMMALLALPDARAAQPQLARLEQELTAAADRMAAARSDEDHALLDRLTQLAAELERLKAATSFRFSAARAYGALVERRLDELQEQRIEGLLRITLFMERRFAPAMRTCEAIQRRIDDLSRRFDRAGGLLRARVGVAQEEQSARLLSSMDRRAKAQLRLQETVEGLSVVAIGYYLIGLWKYLSDALKAWNIALPAWAAQGVAIPIILFAVWIGLRRLRRALSDDDEADGHGA